LLVLFIYRCGVLRRFARAILVERGKVVRYVLILVRPLLPEDGLDAAASVIWLLDSLNSIPLDARKPIRSANF